MNQTRFTVSIHILLVYHVWLEVLSSPQANIPRFLSLQWHSSLCTSPLVLEWANMAHAHIAFYAKNVAITVHRQWADYQIRLKYSCTFFALLLKFFQFFQTLLLFKYSLLKHRESKTFIFSGNVIIYTYVAFIHTHHGQHYITYLIEVNIITARSTYRTKLKGGGSGHQPCEQPN